MSVIDDINNALSGTSEGKEKVISSLALSYPVARYLNKSDLPTPTYIEMLQHAYKLAETNNVYLDGDVLTGKKKKEDYSDRLEDTIRKHSEDSSEEVAVAVSILEPVEEAQEELSEHEELIVEEAQPEEEVQAEKAEEVVPENEDTEYQEIIQYLISKWDEGEVTLYEPMSDKLYNSLRRLYEHSLSNMNNTFTFSHEGEDFICTVHPWSRTIQIQVSKPAAENKKVLKIFQDQLSKVVDHLREGSDKAKLTRELEKLSNGDLRDLWTRLGHSEKAFNKSTPSKIIKSIMKTPKNHLSLNLSKR